MGFTVIYNNKGGWELQNFDNKDPFEFNMV